MTTKYADRVVVRVVTMHWAHLIFLYGNVDRKKDLEAIMKYSPHAEIMSPAKTRLHHKNSMSI